MRKIIFALAASLDGYIARENGDVDWLKMEDLTEGADEMKEFFASIDTIFFGRKTYEKGLEMGGDFNMYGEVMNYVFSRTPHRSEIKNLDFVSENVKEFVEDLKRQDGKNILLMGGGSLAKTFFEEGLIDELIIGIQPVILGNGIPLFLPHEKQTELERFDVKTRKSGTVQISYRLKTE
ncbi:MAG: dihydrofolate reductase [Pyrinomonadaceae bacterium]|nr:dihydrofolate reductase [Pyrinomonadaceae bacterium]